MAQPGAPVRLLFVCLGNICRSPTAEGTMRALVREAGLEQAIELDSAGTGGWHVGSAPDERATAAAAAKPKPSQRMRKASMPIASARRLLSRCARKA